MDETKKPWQSKAMWAGVLALIALNLKTFGVIDVNEADQATITDTIVSFVEQGLVLAAMIGRWIAQKRITL